jgi:type IV pilus assembly protein PilV
MNKNAGFTLIEVLIAMLVLSVGLLGLAGLQATGLKNNQSAYNRSQATQLAYDIADRMRANASATNNYATTFMDPPDATAQADCLVVSTTCTAADMSENDLFDWNTAVMTLPSGIGTITVVAGPPRVFTITIAWDDDHDDNDDNNPSFQTSFQL